MADSATATTIAFAALPALGQPLEGGTLVGITTRKDGTHVATILLPGKAEGKTWDAAKAWAAEQGGELPTRPVAALLFANAKDQLTPRWHWTCEEESFDDDEEVASYAWICHFDYGLQLTSHKGYEGCAVAVRSIPLTA